MRVGALVLLCWQGVAADRPIATNLCELSRQPGPLAGRLVAVRAEVVVGFETQALIDGACPNARIWFEVDSALPSAAHRALRPALRGNLFSSKRLTATLVGRFAAGDCYGHGCFSKQMLLVQEVPHATAIERRLAPDFAPYDCTVMQRDLALQKGPVGNAFESLPVLRNLDVSLVAIDGRPIPDSANPILQIGTSRKKQRTLKPKSGIVRMPALASGAYVFSATAAGFQSVTGCFLINPTAKLANPFRIVLPLGD